MLNRIDYSHLHVVDELVHYEPLRLVLISPTKSAKPQLEESTTHSFGSIPFLSLPGESPFLVLSDVHHDDDSDYNNQEKSSDNTSSD